MKTNNKVFRALLISVLIVLSTTTFAQKDTVNLKPSFWVGGAVGANFNFYRGSTQDINADLFSYPAFHNGQGVGLFLAPALVYHNPDKVLGVMLEVGYDNRKGEFDKVTTPCNCPADLKTNLSYITVEPSLRVAPFKGNFYLYGGPRLAFNLGKSFTYDKGVSVDGTIPAEQIKGKFTHMNQVLVSLNVGMGYDILLSEKVKGHVHKQMVLSPFVDFHPYFGQNPRSIETWNVTTVRIGAVLKFGHVKVAVKVKPVVVVEPTPVVVITKPVVVTPTPVVVVVPKITETYTLFFKFDQSNLDMQSISNLNDLVRDLKANPRFNLKIKSYCDIRGSDSYNIALAKRRSKAVADYLVSKGIIESRIKAESLGETVAFDKDKGKINETNYALNRRANLTVIVIISK
jgi:outer membrane protein OmpA-like peptidoglycan-associated protein